MTTNAVRRRLADAARGFGYRRARALGALVLVAYLVLLGLAVADVPATRALVLVATGLLVIVGLVGLDLLYRRLATQNREVRRQATRLARVPRPQRTAAPAPVPARPAPTASAAVVASTAPEPPAPAPETATLAFRAAGRALDEPATDFRVALVASPAALAEWRPVGTLRPLVPGLALASLDAFQPDAVVVDERAFAEGAWFATTSSAGEGRLVELQAVADWTERHGLPFVVVTAALTPDVNTAAIRQLATSTVPGGVAEIVAMVGAHLGGSLR
ncbi:hypothetical protein ACFT5B_04270 [Luteimicrobium sp. NPDC057192]|uniref:hypothetical protein n=1 Tax=Luteimicrobium sp. NPDC057192 TaxID=3346042 RepID=UPI0036266A59